MLEIFHSVSISSSSEPQSSSIFQKLPGVKRSFIGMDTQSTRTHDAGVFPQAGMGKLGSIQSSQTKPSPPAAPHNRPACGGVTVALDLMYGHLVSFYSYLTENSGSMSSPVVDFDLR